LISTQLSSLFLQRVAEQKDVIRLSITGATNISDPEGLIDTVPAAIGNVPVNLQLFALPIFIASVIWHITALRMS
jgi:hypothetical protein